jgi:hypothetical protein
LQRVSVLILIYENVLKSMLVVLENSRFPTEKALCLEEKIIKVQGVSRTEAGFVVPINIYREAFGGRRRAYFSPGVALIFPTADKTAVGGDLPRITVDFFQNIPKHAFHIVLIVDCKVV